MAGFGERVAKIVVWGDIAPNYYGILPGMIGMNLKTQNKIISINPQNKDLAKINDTKIDLILECDDFDINNLSIQLLCYKNGLWLSDLQTSQNKNNDFFNVNSFKTPIFTNPVNSISNFTEITNKKIAFASYEGSFGNLYMPFFDVSYNTKQIIIEENSAIDVINTPPSNPIAGDIYIVGLNPNGVFLGQAGKVATYGTGWTFTTVANKTLSHNGATNIKCTYIINKL